MDELDRAQALEQTAREHSLNAILSRATEPPEFDEHGERICLDCGEPIPHPRIEAVNAVRCVGCQESYER